MTAPDDDQPIRYIERTHAWYGALGYGNPYRYAQFDEVPFTPLRKPLADCRVMLLTTAAPYNPDLGDQGPGAPYNAAAKFYEVYAGETELDHDLRVSHVAVDQAHLSDDVNCWFPLPALRKAASRGRIGGLTARFLGVPTNRSQRHTLDVDAPEVVQCCREDAADVAVLVANCPVCHQTLSLVARVLEAASIPTVVRFTRSGSACPLYSCAGRGSIVSASTGICTSSRYSDVIMKTRILGKASMKLV